MTPEPQEIVRGLLALIQWMSGSQDFAEGGQAHKGWLRAEGELDAARAWLARADVEVEDVEVEEEAKP